MVTVLAFVAGAFGIAMGASPLLQAIRSHRRQSSADVSLPFLGIILSGGIAWLAYGIAIGNPAIIAANSVGVLSSATTLFISWKWRHS